MTQRASSDIVSPAIKTVLTSPTILLLFHRIGRLSKTYFSRFWSSLFNKGSYSLRLPTIVQLAYINIA